MAPPHGSSPRRGWTLIIVLAIVALGGYFGWRHFYGDHSAATANKSAPPPAAVPVTVAQAQTADFAVYLNGLGVVEPTDASSSSLAQNAAPAAPAKAP